MSRVVHFEIPVDDPDRAVKFYQSVFGWKFDKWAGPQDYWLASTGDKGQPGIDGALRRRGGDEGTVNTIDVPSLDRAVAAAQKSGGTIAVPKMAIPGIGWLAYVKDTEGNVIGMMQADAAAK